MASITMDIINPGTYTHAITNNDLQRPGYMCIVKAMLVGSILAVYYSVNRLMSCAESKLPADGTKFTRQMSLDVACLLTFGF